MISSRRMPLALTVVAGLLYAAGCASTSPDVVQVPPDERFGHRYEDEAPDGRNTITIQPPDTASRYFFYPAVFDTLHVRPAAWTPERIAEGAVPVEVLVKGAFPDGCTELHALSQERIGHLVNVDLVTRRAQGAVCIAVRRPFRFYTMLEGAYEPGPYTLKLNDTPYAFTVPAPEPQ